MWPYLVKTTTHVDKDYCTWGKWDSEIELSYPRGGKIICGTRTHIKVFWPPTQMCFLENMTPEFGKSRGDPRMRLTLVLLTTHMMSLCHSRTPFPSPTEGTSHMCQSDVRPGNFSFHVSILFVQNVTVNAWDFDQMHIKTKLISFWLCLPHTHFGFWQLLEESTAYFLFSRELQVSWMGSLGAGT